MKQVFFFLMLLIFVFSCSDNYDDKALLVAGNYDAVVVGYTLPFNMSVALDYGDNVEIEAIWDGYDWELVKADIDRLGVGEMDIDIPRQWIYGDTEVWGDGYFYEGYLQLDYKIRWAGEIWEMRITADQY